MKVTPRICAALIAIATAAGAWADGAPLQLAARAAADTDYAGNPYPAACSQAAADAISTPLVAVDAIVMARWATSSAQLGQWRIYEGGGHLIFIRRDLAPALYRDVVRHERCHEIMWRLTGSEVWHPDRTRRPPNSAGAAGTTN